MSWKKSDGKAKKRRRVARRQRNSNNRGRLEIYGDAGRQALRDINVLRRFINVEVKYNDNFASDQSSTTATFNLANDLILGTSATTRIGQSVKADGIFLRCAITISDNAVTTFIRFLVVQDLQCNGAQFTIGSLLPNVTVVSPYIVGSQSRFKILLDVNFALSEQGDACLVFDRSLPCSSHTEYNTNNAGTVGDIVTNSIYFVHFSDQSTNTPTVQWYMRYWFIDN